MNRTVKNSLVLIATVIYLAFILFFIEARLHEGIEERLEWIRTTGTTAFILNVLVVFMLFLILLGITNRYMVSFVTTNLVILFLAIMSYYKFEFLAEYLYPWDLFLYNNVINLLPNLYEEIDVTRLIVLSGIILAILVAVIVFIRLRKPPRLVRFSKWSRAGMVVAGLLVLSAFVFYRSFPVIDEAFEKRFGVFNQPWNQNNNYKVNGFFVTFLFNTQSAIVIPPQGYGEKKINRIADEIMGAQTAEESGDNSQTEQPNIIMIMNEAFWDPTLLSEDITFSQDPMPAVRKEQSGWLLSPEFGGGTANVEFEVLTGFTNTFIPSGSVPYQQYITQDLPALPAYLKGIGYKTLAVHPYPKWFWNRELVYGHLGFDDFIDIDRFDNPEYTGPYVSDAEVTQEIIRNIESTDEPLFTYAITMQNHTSYNAGRYEEEKISSQGGNLSDRMRNILDVYTQGVLDADAAFAELTAYLENSEEPTIVVFFGDHMPTLGLDYQVYKEAGYVPSGSGEAGWELEDTFNMRRTPLVFWNNFGAAQPEIETLSASFVAHHALDMAGIKKPPFYSFLKQMEGVMPGFTSDVKSAPDGSLYLVTPDDVDPLREQYMQIQYDILFGDQYSREKLFGVTK
ncbi:Phosphoglycerol transferase MdoB [Bhargavaea ginsengi]|uniref:Phosphoglycerol transferase MdoB n=1 Tax=Bhargavaea ginsengi TaxID=426757 RepID=A0A1H7ABD0_9BACL|nr:LTA synthase family protein [Bhargavaea ginsengi]SEJ62901.1 Phosphoglycerol transferase MdoB [Bhargavaea ginsengi]